MENFPEISFVSSNIESETLTGKLSFRGITNTISFPIKLNNSSIEADFYLNTAPYEMKYTGVNDEVRVAFTIIW